MEITTFNKHDFMREVAKKTDWTLDNSLLAINTIFEIIKEQTLDGKIVSINGVGKFRPTIKKECVKIDLSQKDSNGKLLRDGNGKPITKIVPPRYNVRFEFVPSYKNIVKETPVE